MGRKHRVPARARAPFVCSVYELAYTMREHACTMREIGALPVRYSCSAPPISC